MPDIQVIYPRGTRPIVRNDAEFFSSGEPVIWCFHSDDDRIHSVEVEFTDPRATYFEDKKTDQWGNDSPLKYRAPLRNGRADFYGHVPAYPSETRPVLAKYTVRGFDEQGEVVDGTEVDPVIITMKP